MAKVPSRQALYVFVEAQHMHLEDFVLAKHFPKKVVGRREGMGLREAGLESQEVLFVEVVDKDDEE